MRKPSAIKALKLSYGLPLLAGIARVERVLGTGITVTVH